MSSIRNFAKYFTNLTKAQRMELERAFADVDVSLEMTSLDESLRLLKRKPDQALPVPELTVVETVGGASISWDLLRDQRINFYEVEVSTTSNFAEFSTITTFGGYIILEGLSSTRFVRVRGVRIDGTTTPYSDTATVSVDLYNVRSHTAEAFYVKLEGTSQQTILGGTGTTLDYTPSDANGTSMVWGFLTAYGDPAIAMFGDGLIQAQVWVDTVNADGATTDSSEYARVTLGEAWNSISFGPFPVEHPEAGSSLVIRVIAWDSTTKENGDPRTADSTTIEWCHINVLEVGTG